MEEFSTYEQLGACVQVVGDEHACIHLIGALSAGGDHAFWVVRVLAAERRLFKSCEGRSAGEVGASGWQLPSARRGEEGFFAQIPSGHSRTRFARPLIPYPLTVPFQSSREKESRVPSRWHGHLTSAGAVLSPKFL